MKRRNFLVGCGQAAAFLIPRRLRPASNPDFHLHPQYREQTPLDAAASKIKAGHDEFTNEVHHERMAAVLEEWRHGLLQSPPIAEIPTGDGFVGTSWEALESQPLRPASKPLDVRRLRFSTQPSLTRAAFLSEMQKWFGSFVKILTAEFQITRIDRARSRVRFELVGTGPSFYREQRIGEWLVDWDDQYRIVRWQALDEVRSRSIAPCFVDVTRPAFSANLSFEAQMLHGADYWRTVLDGESGIDIYGHNGVSVGDLCGNGFDDIYVCQAAGLPNRLYRNKGDATFEDITEASGVGLLDNTACALIADFDNDGRQDLVVVRATGPLLFLNQGNGKFRMKPGAFQFAKAPQGTFTGAAAADYNGDGFLDIYFCLYSFYQGTDQYNYPTPYFDAENGPPNFMMHNNGDGTFRDVTEQCGLNKNNTRYSFCCGWNGSDLYVVNDFGRKNLYRNNGEGVFTDVARESGVEDVGAGMSVCWFDDNLYVGNMWTAAGERITHDQSFQANAPEHIRALYQKHSMGNSLFRRNGNVFRDATEESGIGMGRWAWSSDAWDFDHDGFADLYIANGMISGTEREELNSYFWRQVVAKSPNEAKPNAEYEQGWKAINEWIRDGYTWSGFERNVLYANNRDGTFSDVSGALGLDFLEDGRSFALADFDGDGRQELLLKNRNAPQIRVMKNAMPDLPPAIAFRLTGTKSNRDAIGAVVTIGRQTRRLQAGSGFLSQHSKELFFGLGQMKGNVNATIHWPSGLVQELTDLAPNHRVWVTEGRAPTRVEAFKAAAPVRGSEPLPGEIFPSVFETVLLSPILIPSLRRKPGWLTFSKEDASEEAAIYNLIFRSLFDRHRDMPLPTSFLFDEKGQIVKICRGPLTDPARVAKALPFPGVADTYEFGRNYLSLGSIFFQRGYLDVAGDFFRLAPQSAEAMYGRGSVYLKQEKNDQARDCFEQAVKLKAGYPETLPNAWNNLGILATREGDTAKAVGYFEQALRLNQDHFIALENLGNAYRQEKRWEEARTTLTRALAIKPDDAEAHYSLGMVLAQNNDTDGAYEHLQKALRARPVYPEALNNLGILYLRTHRRDEAVAKFEECLRVAPGFDQAYLNLARVYGIEGSLEKERAVLQELLKQHPNHAAGRQMLEQIH